MTLTHEDQLGLIREILYNQKTDCCASVSEYQQIQRLVQSLIGNKNIDGEFKQTLYDIYTYTQPGVNGRNLEQHITQNDSHLDKWINQLDTSHLS